MSSRIVLATLTLAAASAAFAADLIMRPGRWETSIQIMLPGQEQAPPGLPIADAMRQVDCITTADVEALENPTWLLPSEDCSVSEAETSATEIRFSAVCDDVAFDYRLTMHSPDHWTGIAKSHGEDPSQVLTMSLEGKRTANTCSAAELAADESDQ